MSTTLSVREAQAQLPELVTRAVKDAEPCYIERNGQTVAVLVGLQAWRQAQSPGEAAARAVQQQERRVRAYQKKLRQLGPEYWLPPEQQAQLKELAEKEDAGESLTRAERQQLRRLLKRHEQLLIKRAAAMQIKQ